MKFSNREKQLLEILKKNPEVEISLDEIVRLMGRKLKQKPRFFRGSLITCLRNLHIKLELFGIDLVAVTPIGRGHKAAYKVSDRISELVID